MNNRSLHKIKNQLLLCKYPSFITLKYLASRIELNKLSECLSFRGNPRFYESCNRIGYNLKYYLILPGITAYIHGKQLEFHAIIFLQQFFLLNDENKFQLNIFLLRKEKIKRAKSTKLNIFKITKVDKRNLINYLKR